ncbi:hypothetical protein [Paenibacillus kribbensis]|uniref:hypothetical protein n=1 Tax=Paenibacillus kribbensis TaxID=172713 RepID=UPI000838A68B|nr:hypothetical protein [Paenibacillus kribbensis]
MEIKITPLLRLIQGLLWLKILVLIMAGCIFISVQSTGGESGLIHMASRALSITHPLEGSTAYMVGYVFGKLFFRLLPTILILLFIKTKKYKLTLTLLLFVSIFGLNINGIDPLFPVHISMLISILVHKPSRMYLKQTPFPVKEAGDISNVER